MNRIHIAIRRTKRIYDNKNKYNWYKDIFLFCSILVYKYQINKENNELKEKISRMNYFLNF